MIFYTTLISLSFATNVLIKSPAADKGDFFIYSHQSESIRISDYLLECHSKENLQSDLKTAQFHFLNSDIQKAKEYFQKIIDQRWNCDWSTKERNTIVYAFFRLAQLAENEVDEMKLLTDAIGFDDSIAPNETLIPPPVVSIYKKIKKELKDQTYNLFDKINSFSYILRNGKKIETNSNLIKLNPLKARYTFISDSYLPQTFILSPQQLENTSVELNAIVVGTCNDFRISDDIKTTDHNFLVFFSPECIKENTLPMSLGNSTVNNRLSNTTLPQAHEINFDTKPRQSWIRRNYLWVTAAAILTSALVIHQSSKKGSNGSTVVVPSSTFNPDSN